MAKDFADVVHGHAGLVKPRRVEQATQNLYRAYADQTKLAFRKGLDGQKTTAAPPVRRFRALSPIYFQSPAATNAAQ